MNQTAHKVYLGIFSGHDSSISIVQNGVSIFNISEERLSRIKNHHGFPDLSIQHIVSNKIININTPIAVTCVDGYFANNQLIRGVEETKAYIHNKLTEYGFTDITIHIYDHHFAHATSAYYSSGFNDSLVITFDGAGDELSATISKAVNNKITTLYSAPETHSLGYIYSSITAHLGFIPSRHEGKITGLAAYGNPESVYNKLKKHMIVQDGKLIILSKLAIFKSGFFGKIHNILNFGLVKYVKWEFYKKITRKKKACLEEFYIFNFKETAEDKAAGVQKFTEEILVDIISYWVKKTGIKNLSLAGGLFANVKANQHIMNRCGIDEMWVYPNMGDGGISYGTAIAKYYEDNAFNAKKSQYTTALLGVKYSDDEILEILKKDTNITYKKTESISKDTANLVANRKIVGWFQERMEFGPRALGARSIIGMADDPEINKWLNERMHRTEFMPFAPSVLEEHMDNIFDIPHNKFKRPAEYMTITYDVKKEWQNRIAAVNHIDNTARPQMVKKSTNPLYHAMLEELYKLTGIPLTINTSFNVHEEPIVMSPNDALNALHRDVIDVLAIGNYLVERKR